MTNFVKVEAGPERARVGDWAYGQLRSAILAGKLAPEDRLSVPSLAEDLRVSRSPVREAVFRLVREGLAVDIPHRGAVVASYGLVELAGVYEIREVLEGLAARLAADRCSPALVGELRQTFERHRAAVARGDQPAHLEEDARFHALTRQAAAHEWLMELLDQISGKIHLAMLSTSAISGGREQAIADHERILIAIERGDETEAEIAARSHVGRLRERLLARDKVIQPSRGGGSWAHIRPSSSRP